MRDGPTLPLLSRIGASLSHWRETVIEACEFAVRRARDERLGQVAGSLTFTTLLSIVPAFTIGLAILTTLPVFSHIQTNLHDMLLRNLMPESVSDTIFHYLNLFAAKARGLTVIGLLFLGVTAIDTMLTIDRALNTIWRVHRPRPLSQRILIYWSVVTLGPVLLGASLSISSYLASASAGLIQRPPLFIAILIDLVPLVLIALGYAAMYVYIPNCLVRWRHALIGGTAAAIGFELFKRGFAIYLARIPTYTAIYGALAILPIFLLWIYISWYITLIGAAITASIPALLERRWREVPAAGECFVDALRALRVLYLARRGTAPGITLEKICADSELPMARASDVLARLEAAGIVVRSLELTRRGATHTLPDERWGLAARPQFVRLGELFRLFAFDGEALAKSAVGPGDPIAPVVRATPLDSFNWTLDEAFGERAGDVGPGRS